MSSLYWIGALVAIATLYWHGTLPSRQVSATRLKIGCRAAICKWIVWTWQKWGSTRIVAPAMELLRAHWVSTTNTWCLVESTLIGKSYRNHNMFFFSLTLNVWLVLSKRALTEFHSHCVSTARRMTVVSQLHALAMATLQPCIMP